VCQPLVSSLYTYKGKNTSCPSIICLEASGLSQT
jgi:hypothetical protein